MYLCYEGWRRERQTYEAYEQIPPSYYKTWLLWSCSKRGRGPVWKITADAGAEATVCTRTTMEGESIGTGSRGRH